jgi:hypothetical protein
MAFRKGSGRHATAGNIFFAAMLAMGSAGSCLGYLKHQTNNVFGGLLAIYLISTGWLTGRSRTRAMGVFDWTGFLFATAIGALSVLHGVEIATGRMVPNDNVPAGMDIFLGTIILLAAVGDLRMLIRGSISGTPRIARHLWRMCFGLFIATGSFFLGQQQVFPAFLRGSIVLFVLAVLPLVLLVYWLIRVKFTKRGIGTNLSKAQEGASA